MITGECPYCDRVITNAMPDKSPAFLKGVCPNCKKDYWLKASRIQSTAYTEEEFFRNYEIDEKTRSIKIKGGGER